MGTSGSVWWNVSSRRPTNEDIACARLPWFSRSEAKEVGSLRACQFRDKAAQTTDQLSLALRDFAKQLEVITVSAVIGKEMFDDPGLEGDSREPLWPRLRKFALFTGGRTPQGHHLFALSTPIAITPKYDKDSQTHQLSKRGEIYWIALARVAAHMPKLQSMFIQWGFRPCLSYSVKLNSLGAKLGFASSQGWKMLDDLQEAWWETARGHIREGAGFHFVAKEDGRTVSTIGERGRRRPKTRKIKPRKSIEWTRFKA